MESTNTQDKRLFETLKKSHHEAKYSIFSKLEKLSFEPKEVNDNFVLLKKPMYCSALQEWGILDLRLSEIGVKYAYIPSMGYVKKLSGGEKDLYFENNLKVYESLKKVLEEEEFKILYFSEVREI